MYTAFIKKNYIDELMFGYDEPWLEIFSELIKKEGREMIFVFISFIVSLFKKLKVFNKKSLNLMDKTPYYGFIQNL